MEQEGLDSSPLARGTLPQGGAAGNVGGLIPARAGNTAAWTSPAQPTWAHPRSRGEHAGIITTPITEGGSSPLARGTLIFGQKITRPVGLIPARAGNTQQQG